MHIIFKSLNARTSQGGCQQDLHKIFSQGPVQDHALQGPLRGFHQDLYKIFSQWLVKDLGHDLHARTPKRISQDRHKENLLLLERILIQRTSQKPPTRAFIQAPLIHGKDLCKIMQDLQDVSRIFTTRSSHKSAQDRARTSYRISSGSTQQLSHKDLYNTLVKISRSPYLYIYIYILYIHDYIYICYGPPRLHHETLARFKLVMEGPSRELIRSFYQDLRESAKISNMPQRERSHAHKVTRGLRKPCQNSHCAKTRVIRHAKSAKKVPQAIS